MSQLHIVLLEDDDELRQVLLLELQDLGYSVQGAANSQEAIAAATSRHPDIFIADVKMKGMDGLDTLAKLRSAESPFQCMVITGYATEADSIRAIKLGVGDYLRKPFSTGDFVVAVERLASRALMQRQLAAREEAADRLVQWALERVAGSLDLERPLSGMARRKAALVAAGAARRLGLTAPLEQAVLVALSRSEADLDLLLASASPALLSLLEEMDSGSMVESAQLGTAVVAWCEQPGLPLEFLRAQLSRANSPADTERLLNALTDSLQNPGGSAPRAPRSGHLLALGRALQAGGDGAGATQAYLSALEGDAEDGAEALLELARIDPAQYLSRLLERLPDWPARLTVDLACSPDLLAADKRRELLQQSLIQAGRQGLRAPLARARLALWSLGEGSPAEAVESFRVLMEPAHFETLADSIAWLLPPLLTRDKPLGEVDPGSLLVRLVRESPRTVSELVRQRSLEEPAWTRLMDCLERLNSALYSDTLKLLAGFPGDTGRRAQAVLNQGLKPGIPVLRLHSLGSFRLYLGDYEILDSAWANQKSRFLLAYLASHNRPLDQDLLVEQFWPESPLERGKRNLYQALSLIRKTLRLPNEEGNWEWVLRQGNGLVFNRSLPHWHDLLEFQRSLKEDELLQAFHLYEGSYLDGCYMEWAVNLRNTTEQQALDSFEKLAERGRKKGDHAQVLEVCDRLLRIDPCHQRAHQWKMEGFLALSRPQDAVRQFEACRQVLHQELGLEPTTELLRLLHMARLEL